MSDHEEKLINQSEDDNSCKIDVLEWSEVVREQPLDPVIYAQSFTARPSQPMPTQPKDLEPSSDDSKAANAPGSVQSLPSLYSNLSSNLSSNPSSSCSSQSNSWPRSNSERKAREAAASNSPSLRQSTDCVRPPQRRPTDDARTSPRRPTDDARTSPRRPTDDARTSPRRSTDDVRTSPTQSTDGVDESIQERTSDEYLSTYSNQSTLPSSIACDASVPPVEDPPNPYMRRIIWAMASVAFMVCGAGVALVLHSLLPSSDTQPVMEEAQPSDQHEVIDLDLDMGI